MVRLLSVVVAVALLAVTLASPSTAASNRPRALEARTIGDDQAVVTWQRPVGARRFAVQVSTSASFSPGSTRTPRSRKIQRRR